MDEGREEGELYSSDDDEIPTVSAAVSSAAASYREKFGQDALLSKTLEDTNVGGYLYANNSRSLDSNASALSNCQRSTQKSRAPFVPFVIRFSDDDSGSESEELKRSNPSEIKRSTVSVKENKKPLASSVPKAQMLRQTTRHVASAISSRSSLSSTFTSSMTDINIQTPQNSEYLMAEERSRVKNLSTSNRMLVSQKHGDYQSVNLDSNKLQDLRQQIEMREKELKIKSVKQNKYRGSGSCRNYNVSDSEIDVPSKRRTFSANFTTFEVKEPNKKRVKLSETLPIQQVSDAHHHIPPVEPGIPLDMCALDNTDKKAISNRRQFEGGFAGISVQSESAQQEKQVNTLGILPSGTQFTNMEKGVDISINGNSGDMEKLVYPSNSSEQTERVANITVKSLPKKPDFLNDARLCNFWDTMRISQDNDMSMKTPFEIEEMQDKELEEAQEHRHKCEIEERNALKAYRKAQRALIEANARCSHLYRKREFCSAHMQSLIIQNPCFLQSSTLQSGINSLEYMADDVGDLPTSRHQVLDAFGVSNEKGHLLNIKAVDSASHSEQEQNADGQYVANDPFSEPDDSASALQKEKRAARVAQSLSTGLSTSADENDERFSFDDKSANSHLGCRESAKFTNDDLKKRSSLDTSQDSLLLEATLRSQLFARLGTKQLSQNSGQTHNLAPAFEPRAELNGDEGQAETKNGNVSPLVKEKSRNSTSGGNSAVENLSSQFLIQNNDGHVENFSYYCASLAPNLLESYFSSDGKQASRSFTFSCPILMSTSSHLKVAKHDSTVGLKSRNLFFNTYDTYNDEGISVGPPENWPKNFRLNSSDDTTVERSPMDLWCEKVGYYNSNVVIDPFRPLCVFELRGKCNNDECPWQHTKDYSSRNKILENSENLDSQVELSNFGGNFCKVKHTFSGLNCHGLTPPTYLVSLDIIKADSHPHRSLPATNVRQCWQKCLSTSLVLSCTLTSDLHTEEPFLHGSDARVEVNGSRNNQLLYFHRTLSMNQLDQQITDNDQILEMALLNLRQEVDKRKGKIEALKVLARSLEANPSRIILWVAYLHIYHSADHFVVKDDMFCFAVELNQGSYELWLMYINTRMQVEDRSTAYNDGILALCRQGSAADGTVPHTSACILDLFLQYLDYSCSSGNISSGVKKNYENFLPERNSESYNLLLSNILPCLTPSDKYIIWFCCIYLTVYKKLPDAIVQCFECQKELNDIEWPSVYLTFEEKHRADLLMEMAVDSLALVLDNGALESESAISAAHMFAVNHVKCIAVLEGLECSRKLLDNYMKIYPSCLELVLMSAQTKASDFGDLKFVGFEDALKNWEEEVPGVQCIWNQYVNFALQNGRFDFAKQLMDRWFHSVWQVRYSQSASAFDGETSSLNSSKLDIMFGLINLSIHKSFDNDLVEARLAIDGALKSASAENYRHCVKEHVSFLFSSGNAPDGGLLDILKNYLVDHRAISIVQPLSRKFIGDIKKPRVRNLVSNIWSDLSLDFSVVNLVLEVFYGPSLLPHLSCKLEDLVDIVEALMEISPANYRLAISVGKLLSKDVKLAGVASAGVSFWATSLVTSSLFQAIPIPPELTWIEAADTLRNLTDTRSIIESFHKRALTAYPLSIQLWKSYLEFIQGIGNTSFIIAAAKERGIVLD